MANLGSSKIEKKLLSLLFIPPYHTKAVSMKLGVFSKLSYRKLAEVIKKYVIKYKQPPTKDTLILFCNDIAKDKSDLDEMSSALLLIDKLPKADPKEYNYYFEKAENYRVGRKIFDYAEYIKETFEDNDEIDYIEMHKKLSSQIISMTTTQEKTRRGFVYESVKERWDNYGQTAKGENTENIVPFGISGLDDILGGIHKSFVTLMYSKTGGGKTRTAINVAINAAQAGFNVIYFTLEMALPLLGNCIDSRLALVNSNHILFGKLSKKDKKVYKEALIKQAKEKLGIWIVDIPSGVKTMDIRNEIAKYRAITGLDPDLTVIDYANLVEPMIAYNGRSEKYDFLFKEFHEIAREEYTGLLTATMETRDRSKQDKIKKKKDTDDEGVENIGLSNYIAPHCENIIRLSQNKWQKLQNKLLCCIDKSRYGNSGEIVTMTARWDITYVGDKLIPGTKGVRIIKDNDS